MNAPSVRYRDNCVIGEVRRMLKSLEIHTSTYYPGEMSALAKLAQRGEVDLELTLVKFVMELLGSPQGAAKEKRFDKTHRALNRKKHKGPRGVPKKSIAIETPELVTT